MIPQMTGPLSRYWEQPNKENILIDDTHAMMDKAALRLLKEYSCSLPSGVYEGKMWKLKTNLGWVLRWYGPSVDPNKCSINNRIILIA